MSQVDPDEDAPELATQLRDLLQSPGWQWFVQQIHGEYGPAAYGKRINAALSKLQPGPEYAYEVAEVTQRIHAESNAVNALVSRPKAMLDSLTSKPSRRPFDRYRRTLETHR